MVIGKVKQIQLFRTLSLNTTKKYKEKKQIKQQRIGNNNFEEEERASFPSSLCRQFESLTLASYVCRLDISRGCQGLTHGQLFHDS